MKRIEQIRRFAMVALAAVSSVCLVSCGEQASDRAEAEYFRQQEEVLDRQTREWDQQLARANVQEKRYEALLTSWENQAKRANGLLDRWEGVLISLEERTAD